MTAFTEALEAAADRVTVTLDSLLPLAQGPEARVISAMRYGVLGPGKRLRPFITLQCGALVGADERALLRAACAVECVHAYSLIHDDLPAMDDDDIRRGRPTVHMAYDEATAILAGDALLTFAFEILADGEMAASPGARCRLISALAKAAGAQGMVGGQMIDIALSAPGAEAPEIGLITRMQRMKTGALIRFCAEAGAILVDAPQGARTALDGFAHDLGLVYQIADDLLDAQGAAHEAGKAVGKDAGQGKATFIGVLGSEAARDRARRLAAQAQDHLDFFGPRANTLKQAVDFVLERRR